MSVAPKTSSPLAGEEGTRREAVGRRGGKRDLLHLAKQMRGVLTDAERRLWSIVRGKRLAGLKFKRQEQIGEYIVDFVCFQRRPIVEVDCGQHSDSDQDLARDAWLTSNGFRILRFWNNDVLENCKGVMQTIIEATSAPSPTSTGEHARKSAYPLPQGERNERP